MRIFLIISLISFSILPVHAGISSITSENIVTVQEVATSSERQIIRQFIRKYKNTYGLQRLEAVYAKLDEAMIGLFPASYRPYLIMIREIIEEDYRIGIEIPTAQQIQAQGNLQKDTEAANAQRKQKNTDVQEVSERQFAELGSEEIDVKKPQNESGEKFGGETVSQNTLGIQLDLPLDQPSVQTESYQLSQGTIDVARLQQAWLGWVNEVRSERGRQQISLSEPLHETAAERSLVMKNKGTADHRRYATSSYYNYGELVEWFGDRGVVFENISRATFTENVGYARFTCKTGDCTQDAISAMRKIFDYFISEEGEAYDAHWRTIIQPNFQIMGMGIAIDENNKWLYVTQHYGTRIK